jgi:hypothetical protein
MKWRVLWTDAAGEGRFTTVEAATEAEAAWSVAITTESTLAKFEDIVRLSAAKAHKQ